MQKGTKTKINEIKCNVDLHLHSQASDGSFAAGSVVDMAKDAGIEILSITDHDTIGGQVAAKRRAGEHGLTYFTGVEFSIDFENEMHIIGYCIDIDEKEINLAFGRMVNARNERNPAIVKRLNELGMPLTMEDVIAESSGGTIGRSHIASAMVKKNYVKDHKQAFSRFLSHGKPGYISSKRMKPERAMELILGANGLPVLAHPVSLKAGENLSGILRYLKEIGLWGVEVYHPSHFSKDTDYFYNLAKKLGLMITGGSDFHGASKPKVSIGDGVRAGCPGLAASVEFMKNIQDFAKKRS